MIKSEEDTKFEKIDFTIKNQSKQAIISEETSLLNKLVQLKDKINFSFLDYNEIRKQICPHWPSEYFLRKAIEMYDNGLFEIFRNKFGCYVDSGVKITDYIKKHFNEMEIKNNIIRVKLVGDGTKIGPLTMLNFGFTLPDMGAIAKTAAGNYVLGCFEIEKENYETLRSCLAEIAKDLSEFVKNNKTTIQIGTEVYTIKFLLGGDMKFLHTSMGLNACNSNNPCLWCKWHKDFFSNLSAIALPEIASLRRTIEEQLKHFNEQSLLLGTPESMLGYSNIPVFDFINFEDCVFDTLHLLLRIVEKLMKLILAELETLDDNNSCRIEDLKYQFRFFQSLQEIGVQNPIYYEKEVFKMKSFDGDDCLLILEKLDFELFFPEISFPLFTKRKVFNSLLRDFNGIFLNIKANYYVENKNILQTKTDEWLDSYTATFHLKHVTGYIHIFCHHLCSFIEEHGDVDVYNCQGIEKRNHQLTREYFASNRKYNQKNYQCQMILQRNRIESYKKSEPKKIKKRENFKIRHIRNLITNEEDKQEWVQYIIDGQKIYNFDLFETFSRNVSIFT